MLRKLATCSESSRPLFLPLKVSVVTNGQQPNQLCKHKEVSTKILKGRSSRSSEKVSKDPPTYPEVSTSQLHRKQLVNLDIGLCYSFVSFKIFFTINWQTYFLGSVATLENQWNQRGRMWKLQCTANRSEAWIK